MEAREITGCSPGPISGGRISTLKVCKPFPRCCTRHELTPCCFVRVDPCFFDAFFFCSFWQKTLGGVEVVEKLVTSWDVLVLYCLLLNISAELVPFHESIGRDLLHIVQEREYI